MMMPLAKLNGAFNKLHNFYEDMSSGSLFKLEIESLSPMVYLKQEEYSNGADGPGSIMSGIAVLYLKKSQRIKNVCIRFCGNKKRTHIKYIHDPFNGITRYQKSEQVITLLDEIYQWEYSSRKLNEGVYKFPFLFIVNSVLPESYESRHFSSEYYIKFTVDFDTNGSINNKENTIIEPIKLIRFYQESPYQDCSLASGNWRDLLVYQFSFQSKVAFQDTQFSANIKIYPIMKNSFKIHHIAVWLTQVAKHQTFDSSVVKNSFETDKFLLLKRFLNTTQPCKDQDKFMNFELFFHIPDSCSSYSSNGKKVRKKILTSLSSFTEGTVTSHNLKLVMSISEISPTQKYNTSEKDQGFLGIIPTNGSDLQRELYSEMKDGSIHSTMPSYTTYHEQRYDETRFKKIELSFSAPITLLSHESMLASASPPLYEKTVNKTPESINMSDDKGLKLTPPAYSKIK